MKDLLEEQKQLTGKLSRLADLLIDGSLDQTIYVAKQKEIIVRRSEIDIRLKQVDAPAQDDPNALWKVVSLVSKCAEIFGSSKTEQKRLMLGFVFSNLSLEGGKSQIFLEETLRAAPTSTKKSRMACCAGSNRVLDFQIGDCLIGHRILRSTLRKGYCLFRNILHFG